MLMVYSSNSLSYVSAASGTASHDAPASPPVPGGGEAGGLLNPCHVTVAGKCRSRWRLRRAADQPWTWVATSWVRRSTRCCRPQAERFAATAGVDLGRLALNVTGTVQTLRAAA